MLTRPDIHTGTGLTSVRYDDFAELTPARVLVEVLGRWRFILAAAVFGALLATAAWYYMLTPTYQSEAYIAISRDNPGRQKAMLYSPVVLDPIITGSLASDTARDRARAVLRRKVTIEPAQGEDRKSPSVFALRVEDKSPQQAHAIATAVLDQFIKTSQPRPVQRERLLADIEHAQAQRDEIIQLIERFESETATLISSQSDSGELATPLAQLIAKRAAFDARIEDLNNQIQGMTTDAILSPPTLPDTASRPVPWFAATALGLFIGLGVAIAYLIARFAIPLLLDDLPSRDTRYGHSA